MRATWPGARSGRISSTTLPLVVSSVSVSSGLAIRKTPSNSDSKTSPLSWPGLTRPSRLGAYCPSKRGRRDIGVSKRRRSFERLRPATTKLFLDRRLFHVVELGKALREIGVAFGLDAVLVGA